MYDRAKILIRFFEGFRPAPYLCPAGVPTIGYGSTHYEDGQAVTLSDPPIDSDRAERLLELEIVRCLPGVLSMAPVLGSFPDSRDAIIDFIYNLGSGRFRQSTLRRRIAEQDWEGAKVELAKWVWGGGRRLPGLIRRRAAESVLMGG